MMCVSPAKFVEAAQETKLTNQSGLDLTTFFEGLLASKLPKRFSVTPADTPRVLPTTDPFPGTEEPDARETRSKNSGSKGKGRCDERSNDSDMDFGQQEQGSDEEWGSGDESEGYDGEDYDEDGEGPDDGAETNDELGFKYDDEYMT